jgi:hypothetical protein
LFFLVLGLERQELTRFTGAVAIVAGVLTCAVPAFLLLSLALYPRLRGPRVPAATEPAPELRGARRPGQWPGPRSRRRRCTATSSSRRDARTH